MQISITDAESQLTELVRRAPQGDEIILTEDGRTAVRFVPVKKAVGREARRALLEELRKASVKATLGPCAARSQDFLYDEAGLRK